MIGAAVVAEGQRNEQTISRSFGELEKEGTMSNGEHILREMEFADWYLDLTGRMANDALSLRARRMFLDGNLITIRTREDIGQFLVSADGHAIGVRPIKIPLPKWKRFRAREDK